MSKKSRFRGPFDKQHRKRAQALLKSASVDLYPIVWSLKCQLSWKNSPLLTWQILGLLVKALAVNEKYPHLKRENLTIPIQMQLSRKEETSSLFSPAFLKSRWNFQHFDKKDALIDFVILKLRTLKSLWDKCLKSSVWENPLASNMVNVPKHCWNLHHSTFIIFIDHCQGNWVGKSLSYWHAKSWDCLLTHWLLMKSILFLLETNNNDTNSDPITSKTKYFFSIFCCIFEI